MTKHLIFAMLIIQMNMIFFQSGCDPAFHVKSNLVFAFWVSISVASGVTENMILKCCYCSMFSRDLVVLLLTVTVTTVQLGRPSKPVYSYIEFISHCSVCTCLWFQGKSDLRHANYTVFTTSTVSM